MGCLDVWGPQETPGCPSSAPEAPLASRALEVSLDFRAPLDWMAGRAWQVPEDYRGLRDRKEKRASVASTRIGENKARRASKDPQAHRGPLDQVAF